MLNVLCWHILCHTDMRKLLKIYAYALVSEQQQYIYIHIILICEHTLHTCYDIKRTEIYGPSFYNKFTSALRKLKVI